MTIRLNNTPRDTALDGIDTFANTGGVATLVIYTGAVQGTFGTVPAGTLITTITFGAVAFAASANGVMVSSTMADTGTGVGGGTAAPSALVAASFVILNGAGAVVLDGNVGTTGTDLILTDVNIGNGVVISIPSVTLTAGNSPT